MSAMQLKRTLWGEHSGSYKTAWYLCHRIRAAMASAEKTMLDGTVEMDETCVGGEKNPKALGAFPMLRAIRFRCRHQAARRRTPVLQG